MCTHTYIYYIYNIYHSYTNYLVQYGKIILKDTEHFHNYLKCIFR